MTARLRTVMVGFGQVADTLGDDKRMRRYFHDASHAEVLSKHPAFEWDAVVDPSEAALQRAREKWGIKRLARDISGLGDDYQPDIAVVAAPPEIRLAVIEALPSLSGLLVEKPLGRGIEEARGFVSACEKRQLPVQVHFWRRGVPGFQDLANGELVGHVGEIQGVFGLYGRGLFNNGSHLVDFARMLLGEVNTARALSAADPVAEPELRGDMRVPFALTFANGVLMTALPVAFAHYREVGLDIWGTTGRLSIMQESLSVIRYPLSVNRGLMNESEIASDQPQTLDLPVGMAYGNIYDNLAAAVTTGAVLVSDAASALRTMQVLDGITRSARDGGVVVDVG